MRRSGSFHESFRHDKGIEDVYYSPNSYEGSLRTEKPPLRQSISHLLLTSYFHLIGKYNLYKYNVIYFFLFNTWKLSSKVLSVILTLRPRLFKGNFLNKLRPLIIMSWGLVSRYLFNFNKLEWKDRINDNIIIKWTWVKKIIQYINVNKVSLNVVRKNLNLNKLYVKV